MKPLGSGIISPLEATVFSSLSFSLSEGVALAGAGGRESQGSLRASRSGGSLSSQARPLSPRGTKLEMERGDSRGPLTKSQIFSPLLLKEADLKDKAVLDLLLKTLEERFS